MGLKPWSTKGGASLAESVNTGRESVVDVNASGANSVLASPRPSRPASIYPEGDFRRRENQEEIHDIKCDISINWLHQQQKELGYTSDGPSEGLVLKRRRDDFICYPPTLEAVRGDFFDAIRALNVKVAITIKTRIIKLILADIDGNYLQLNGGLRIQILPTMASIATCQKHHFAAFIRDVDTLVVWADEPQHLLDRAAGFQKKLIEILWATDDEPETPGFSKEKGATVNVSSADSLDLENNPAIPRRPVMANQAILTGLTIMLTSCATGLGVRSIATEIGVDGNMVRLALLVVIPVQVWASLFFFQTIFSSLLQIIGPMRQMQTNSKYFSANKSPRINYKELPHVTIQCPVYKEGLKNVIIPTITSVEQAISTYEMQGGTANIFINDDGMQLISKEDAQARMDFYDEHNIGWVARPGHKPKPEDGSAPFIRPGKFKKASNMNYALNVSTRIEEKLSRRPPRMNNSEDTQAYRECLREVMDEDEGRTWADGDVRVGDYILIIDADTKVPADCFLDAVSEMENSPQVAIIQYKSDVFNVTTSFFEAGITFFTRWIYTAISFAVACGDVAPFVGHNAVLRWSAIQDVATLEDDREKWWCESTVSEDFELALRLQSHGYHIRYATYCGDGFKEGVSLTVYDELARWEKYAYGCSELVFHPFRYWFTRGPFTQIFRRFMTSPMPAVSKITIMAYIGTYFAIGSSWLLILVNYALVGIMNGTYDHFYLDSFAIWLSLLVVFNALGNVALAVFRYRMGTHNAFKSVIENISWMPLLFIFLGGCSLHVSQAILCHLFSIDISWGATTKEAEDTSFFIEIPKLLKKFKGTFIFVILEVALIICGAFVFPVLWRINTVQAIFPVALSAVCHFLLPTVLNPSLMLFTW